MKGLKVRVKRRKLTKGAQKWSTNANRYDLSDVGTTKCALANEKARHNSLRGNQA
jgi:hypothetical protein